MTSNVLDLLSLAVADLGGAPRPGQQKMATAVAAAIKREHHLAVQAGTGTGKSLAYLIPSIAVAMDSEYPVIVSTATIALQRQLVERDLPRLAKALEPELPRPLDGGSPPAGGQPPQPHRPRARRRAVRPASPSVRRGSAAPRGPARRRPPGAAR